MGAAIVVLDGNISISNSQFVNNNAGRNYPSIGVILLFESEASIDNSDFTNNAAW